MCAGDPPRLSKALWSAILLFVLGAASLSAQARPRPWPQGMFCGGNELRFEGVLKASKVKGVVLFYDRSAALSDARVQVQIKGRTDILIEVTADAKGRFKLPDLRPGEYWLGVSSLGFNLHYWDLTINRSSGTKEVRVALSLGT